MDVETRASTAKLFRDKYAELCARLFPSDGDFTLNTAGAAMRAMDDMWKIAGDVVGELNSTDTKNLQHADLAVSKLRGAAVRAIELDRKPRTEYKATFVDPALAPKDLVVTMVHFNVTCFRRLSSPDATVMVVVKNVNSVDGWVHELAIKTAMEEFSCGALGPAIEEELMPLFVWRHSA